MDEQQQQVNPPTADDVNEFRRLLARKGQIFAETFKFPFHDKPLVVFYKVLESGEEPPPNYPEDFATRKTEEKMKIQMETLAERVFASIRKADPETPEAYKLSRQAWDDLRRHFPQVYEQIVLKISGLGERIAESFFAGPRAQGSSSP